MTKTFLLRSAAIGAVLAVGLGATVAQAADKDDCTTKCVAHHHRHHKAHAATAENPLVGEVAALKAEVAALERRLDASQAASQQAQASAAAAQASAQASAQAAQSAVQADELAIKQIPGDVKTAVAAMPKPKPGWEGSTTVGATVFYNFSDIEQKTNGVKVAPSGAGFDVKRTYISVDHKFNDVFSANLTTDALYSSSTGTDALLIKKAYLQAVLAPALTVRLGAAEMPWIPFVEGLYGYRYVEQTVVDRTKFGTSTDWGIHTLGKFFDGHLNYALSVVDGAGYKAPGQPGSGTQGRSRSVDVEGRLSGNVGPFTVAVGGYAGKLAKDPVGVAAHHTAQRFDALAAYVTPQIRLGVEYFNTENWTAVTSVVSDKSDGYSGFGSFNFTKQIAVFGRYDYVKPNASTVSSKKDNYFNVGISYEPVKIVDFSLVYKRDKVDHGSLSTGNGVIGATGGNGTYDEVGLFGLIKY